MMKPPITAPMISPSTIHAKIDMRFSSKPVRLTNAHFGGEPNGASHHGTVPVRRCLCHRLRLWAEPRRAGPQGVAQHEAALTEAIPPHSATATANTLQAREDACRASGLIRG